MKKLPTILFILLLIFPIISAVEINMPDEFSQGETLFATIQGNFIDPISKSNVYFYRGHVRIALDYDIQKIQDKYYLYAQLENKLPDNYSISIKEVRYYNGSQISYDDITKNFEINSDTADFSVDPGFIITEGNFELELKNLQSSGITVNIQTEESENSETLLLGQTKNIEINLENINETTITIITLNTDNLEYNVPAYIIVSSESETECGNNIIETGEQCDGENLNSETCATFLGGNWEGELFCNSDCSFNSSSCSETNETSENETAEDCLINWNCKEGEKCINRKCVKVTDDETENQTEEKEEEEIEEDYEIIVEDDGDLIVIKDGEVIDEPASLKNCAELEGDVCSSSQICEGESVYAKDNVCCIGNCVKQEETNNQKLIGWLIIVFIGFLFILLLRKFKSSGKRKKDLLLRRR